MSKSKGHTNEGNWELTKPNTEKVKQKILNTAKCVAEQQSNVYPRNNLERLKIKYPKIAEGLADSLEKIAA